MSDREMIATLVAHGWDSTPQNLRHLLLELGVAVFQVVAHFLALRSGRALMTLDRERSHTVLAHVQSRSRKSAKGDKWSFCLTAGTLCPANQERR
jgi:hypothetical protein